MPGKVPAPRTILEIRPGLPAPSHHGTKIAGTQGHDDLAREDHDGMGIQVPALVSTFGIVSHVVSVTWSPRGVKGFGWF